MHGDSRETSEARDASTREPTAERDETDRGADKAGSAPAGDSPLDAANTALARAEAEAVRMKEAWQRTAADFDNFRKRTRRELDEARRGGREDLVRTLLPVFDNLERALQSAQRSTDVKAMVDGLSMVQRQFVEALGREGIGRVTTVGQPFDPGLHEAIQQVETDEHSPGTVIAEVQPGYVQGDRLLRAAMVVVARAKPNGADDEPGAVN